MTVTPLRRPTASEQALAQLTTVVADRGIGDFHRVIDVRHGCQPEPTSDGTAEYLPRRVLLLWATIDGITWTFVEAKLTGVLIDRHTGQPSLHPHTKTYRAGQPGPAWLPALITAHAPGQENQR